MTQNEPKKQNAKYKKRNKNVVKFLYILSMGEEKKLRFWVNIWNVNWIYAIQISSEKTIFHFFNFVMGFRAADSLAMAWLLYVNYTYKTHLSLV